MINAPKGFILKLLCNNLITVDFNGLLPDNASGTLAHPKYFSLVENYWVYPKGWLGEYEQKTILFSTLAFCCFLFIVFGSILFVFTKKRYEKATQLKFIEIRENERRKIAKSLHDEVVGDMLTLDNTLKRNNLLEASKELQRVRENVRSLSHQLSSVSFEDIPFKEQIKNLVSDYFDSGLNLTVQGLNDIDWNKLNYSITRVLFLSVREGIHNVDKHASADNILISFSYDGSHAILSISDDGQGFISDGGLGGIGLKNIQERVEEISGTLSIRSKSNQGTDLNIQIPIYDE